jgi:hypothetical protein
MRTKINIDTLGKINKFVNICSQLDCKVNLVDGEGYCVSAKSLMGAIATMDWSNVYAECERDIYTDIREFVVE